MLEPTEHAIKVLTASEKYLDLGWHLLPVAGLGDGRCDCRKAGCESPGKHPRISEWQKKASNNLKQVERWVQKWPQMNLGLQLGPRSGVVDVEYDDDEGRATAEELLPDCFTPSYQSCRSIHRLFLWEEGLPDQAVMTVRGLEFRLGGDKGAQSLVPPSRHHSGVSYGWLPGLSPDDVDVQPLPQTLRNLLQQQEQQESANPLVFEVQGTLEDHPGVSKGKRNNILCELVGSYLRANGPDDKLLPLGLTWGERCQPPMEPARVQELVAGLLRKHLKQPPTPAPVTNRPRLILRPYSEIPPEQVTWVWEQRIPAGKLTLVIGDPGLGKTFACLDIAAHVSTGEPFVDGTYPPHGKVIIATVEDGAGDTIRPRLDSMGADVANVLNLDGIAGPSGEPESGFLLDTHIPLLEQALIENPDVKLMLIDPLSGHFGDKDSHKDTQVRGVLAPLCKLAERYKVAILGIAHMSKSNQGKTLYRSLGSIAFTATARAAWGVVQDPEHEDQRLFLPVKNNLGNSTGLAYRLENGRVIWDSTPVDYDIDNLPFLQEDNGKLDEAKAWLQYQLSAGPLAARDIYEQAKSDGIAKRTLDRAKADLGVWSERQGSGWCWFPPTTILIGNQIVAGNIANPRDGNVGNLEQPMTLPFPEPATPCDPE